MFAATFAPAPDSDDEQAAAKRASKGLAFKIKPIEDDPFAAHARPVTTSTNPAVAVESAVAATAAFSSSAADSADPFAAPTKAVVAVADGSDPFAAAAISTAATFDSSDPFAAPLAKAAAADAFDPFGPPSGKASVGSDVGPDGRRLSSFFTTTDDFAQLANAVPVLHTIAQAEAGDPFAGATDLDSSA